MPISRQQLVDLTAKTPVRIKTNDGSEFRVANQEFILFGKNAITVTDEEEEFVYIPYTSISYVSEEQTA